MNQDSTEGSGMIEAMAWLEVNKKRLAIGALVLLVVGFGVYLYNHFAAQKEVTASAALIQLRPTPGLSTNEIPVAPSAYLKIAEEHSGTAAAQRAIILAAGAYFAEGKYSDAQSQFDRFLAANPSSPWAADAAYGIAASLESQGKRDEALTAYQRVVTGFGTSSVVNEARMALARIYEAKSQPAEALKQYDELMRGGMMSMRTQDAMMRRGQLLKKHPELDKPATNAIPAMSPIKLAPPTNAPANASTNKPAAATNAAAAPAKK